MIWIQAMLIIFPLHIHFLLNPQINPLGTHQFLADRIVSALIGRQSIYFFLKKVELELHKTSIIGSLNTNLEKTYIC